MADHLIKEYSLASARYLGTAFLGFSRFGSLSAVGRIAQKNAVQAGGTSFDDVAELVVCEEKGTQVDLGVDLKPSFSRS